MGHYSFYLLTQRKLSHKGSRYLFHANLSDLSQLVRLNFGLSVYLDLNFGLRPSLSKSISPNFEVFGVSDSLSKITAQDYNRGFGIIRHNIPKVAANNSCGILRNLTSDNKAIIFAKLLVVAGK